MMMDEQDIWAFSVRQLRPTVAHIGTATAHYSPAETMKLRPELLPPGLGSSAVWNTSSAVLVVLMDMTELRLPGMGYCRQ